MDVRTDGRSEPSCPDAMMQWLDGGLFGAYLHAIDAKGRLIVPVAFRESLGQRFAIAPTMDFRAIALYPMSVWKEQLMKLFRLRDKNMQVQEIIDHFAKLSFPGSETDVQGRILIPQRIRSVMLGEAKDVEIGGAGDHIRIISGETAALGDTGFREKYPDVLGFLGGIT